MLALSAASLGRVFTARFDGEVSPMPYAIFRVGLALLVLVRTSDVLAPLVALDHHVWVHGLEHAPWSDPVLGPRLLVPLVPGLAVAGAPAVAAVLVVVRVLAAFAVLVGLGGRPMALALALSGWTLMAADRFQYLHHVQLLWLSCVMLALMPAGERLAPFARTVRDRVPKWPLVVARYHLLVVYAAAGVAKLTGDWLSGRDVTALADAGLVSRDLVASLGAQLVAVLSCAVELALVPLLAWPKTRVLGVAVGIAFHVATAATMMVSVFPGVMVLHLLLFLPWAERPSAEAPWTAPETRRKLAT